MPYIANRDLQNAYTSMAIERLDQGFEPYMLTLMFNPIHGSADIQLSTMQKEATWLYGRLLTRAFRSPNEVPLADLPLWIVCPDYPVPKSHKQPLRDVSINDGRHLQGAVMCPPTSRLKKPFNLDLAERASDFSGPGRTMARIHVQRIYTTPEVAFDYVFKALDRGRVTGDDILVLPRTHSEMTAA